MSDFSDHTNVTINQKPSQNEMLSTQLDTVGDDEDCVMGGGVYEQNQNNQNNNNPTNNHNNDNNIVDIIDTHSTISTATPPPPHLQYSESQPAVESPH